MKTSPSTPTAEVVLNEVIITGENNSFRREEFFSGIQMRQTETRSKGFILVPDIPSFMIPTSPPSSPHTQEGRALHMEEDKRTQFSLPRILRSGLNEQGKNRDKEDKYRRGIDSAIMQCSHEPSTCSPSTSSIPEISGRAIELLIKEDEKNLRGYNQTPPGSIFLRRDDELLREESKGGLAKKKTTENDQEGTSDAPISRSTHERRDTASAIREDRTCPTSPMSKANHDSLAISPRSENLYEESSLQEEQKQRYSQFPIFFGSSKASSSSTSSTSSSELRTSSLVMRRDECRHLLLSASRQQGRMRSKATTTKKSLESTSCDHHLNKQMKKIIKSLVTSSIHPYLWPSEATMSNKEPILGEEKNEQEAENGNPFFHGQMQNLPLLSEESSSSSSENLAKSDRIVGNFFWVLDICDDDELDNESLLSCASGGDRSDKRRGEVDDRVDGDDFSDPLRYEIDSLNLQRKWMERKREDSVIFSDDTEDDNPSSSSQNEKNTTGFICFSDKNKKEKNHQKDKTSQPLRLNGRMIPPEEIWIQLSHEEDDSIITYEELRDCL